MHSSVRCTAVPSFRILCGPFAKEQGSFFLQFRLTSKFLPHSKCDVSLLVDVIGFNLYNQCDTATVTRTIIRSFWWHTAYFHSALYPLFCRKNPHKIFRKLQLSAFCKIPLPHHWKLNLTLIWVCLKTSRNCRVQTAARDRKTHIKMFADDAKIHGQRYHPDTDSYLLQEDLDSIERWCQQWLLKLHPEKCKVMRVGQKTYWVEDSGSSGILQRTGRERSWCLHNFGFKVMYTV